MRRLFFSCLLALGSAVGFAGELKVMSFNVSHAPIVARVVATANRSDCRYASGEQAAVSFAFVDTNGVPLKAGRVKLTVDNWGTRELLPARTVDLAAENPIRVATSRATPGFVRMILASADPKTLCIEGNWCWGRHLDDFTYGLGYDVDKIVSGTPDVPDFDAFWSNAVARLDATVPVDARVEPRPSANAEFVVSRISVATAQGRRVWGWLTEPADRSKGPYPLHVDVSGAGIGETEPHKGLPGRIACLMNVHTYPQPEGTGKSVEDERLRLYREQNKRLAEPCGVKEYYHAGIHRSRGDYFYYAVILGLNRTVNWLASRPECDAARVTYGGTSQGGGMGLALAYLNPHISRATIAVPAVTDLLGSRAEEGRLSGWPGLVEAQKPENRAAAAANAPYFCGVNFARRIRKPIRFAVGFADRTCPPMAGYAAFNACPSADKDILGGVAMSHQPFDEFYKQLDDWECHSRPHDGKMIFHGED